MNRKKILLLSAAGLCLSLTSCSGTFPSGQSNSQGGPTTSSLTNEDEILKVYRLYMENGGTMTYEEWLSSIKGEPGKDGVTLRHGQGAPANELGNDGDSYIDLESWDYYLKVSGSWIKSGNLRGEKGDQGEKGDKGDDGVSVVSIEKTSSEGLSDTYTITYSDGTTSTFVVTNGKKGDQGIQGVPGENGHTPVVTVGENGNWFVDGEDTGVHVQGVQGPQGEKGDKGDKGDDGVSVVSIEKTGSDGLLDTYTITYSDGTTSTFVVANGEKGDQGIQGIPGQDGHSPVVTVGENGNWFVDGEDTGVHAQGIQGPKGEDGVSIVTIAKTSESGLADIYTITYSDGHTSTFVVMNGEKGDQGIQGVPGQDGHAPVVTIGENGNWFVDGEDTGVHAQGIQGPKGDKGDKGDTGNDGVSIVSIEKISSEGLVDTYQITYSDGTSSTFTVTNGQKGDKGDTGEKGDKGDKGDPGADGKDGSDGKSAYEIYKEAHPEYEGDEQQWLDDLVNGRLGTEEKKTYTVTFDLGYNDLSFTQKVEEGKKAKRPEDPVRKFYTFVDWVDEYKEHWVFNGYPITEDITLSAVWDCPYEYTVTFLNEDGSFLAEQKANNGDKLEYPLEETPRPGNPDPHYIYNFTGWKNAPETITGDITVIAQYEMTYISTTAYYYDYDGETLLATVPLAEGEAPHYDGETPTRERDKTNKLQFEFEKWEKAEETSSSVKFVAKYASCTDGLDIEGNAATYYHGTSTDVVIPSTWGGVKITRIAEKTFNGCSSVKSVAIPDSVTSIGDYAFQGCSSVASITIPDSVTSIGYSAFSGCSSLASVTIPDSVASIGGWAFAACSSLASVTIPDSVASLWDGVFDGCSSLASITIPDSVTSIGYGAFRGCSSLASVTIPDSVTSIGAWAFDGCSFLASITIPDSVTSIGGYAFSGCSSLTIYVQAEYAPKGWDPSWNSYQPVRFGYRGTKTINGITYFLQEMDGEKYASVTSCDKSIEKAVIEDAINDYPVTLIEDEVFWECASLASVIIPDSVASIGSSAFFACSSLTSVTIPDSVTSIGRSAFAGCSSLTSVTIPDSVTSIGAHAFDGCSSLASITIPDSIISIEEGAFCGCSSLTSLVIPDSVTSIGSSAFSGCSSLTSVTIPDSVTSIGSYAFPELLIYTKVEHSPIEWNPVLNGEGPIFFGYQHSETIDDITYAFQEIDGKKIVTVESLNKNVENVVLAETIGGYPVTSIGGCVFKECTSLNSVNIPRSVTSIGGRAFEGCTSLTSVELPDSVTRIGNYAFDGCSSLASITIPDSVTSIGGYVFYGCSSLTSVTIPDSVTSIEDFTFYECISLTSITIPDSVTSIGNSAFCKCGALATVNIPSSVTSIEAFAFSNCTSLTSVILPDSVTTIQFYAFSNCSSLTIYCKAAAKPEGWHKDWNPSNRPVVWGYQSSGVENGYSYYVLNVNGEDVAYIYTYSGEQSETLTIPSTLGGAKVVALGNGLFKGCDWLKTLIIPEGVTEIGNDCFYQCTSLVSIVIPTGVAKINYGTFWYDSALQYAYYCGTAEEWAKVDRSVDIGSEFSGATVYFYSEEEPQEAGNYWHYVDGVPTVW